MGISNTSLFREITGIEDALKLWDKIERDRKRDGERGEGVVQMEDGEGNVMPEKVYYEYVFLTPFPPIFAEGVYVERMLIDSAVSKSKASYELLYISTPKSPNFHLL